jgi:hypothetical protein
MEKSGQKVTHGRLPLPPSIGHGLRRAHRIPAVKQVDNAGIAAQIAAIGAIDQEPDRRTVCHGS